MDYTLLAFGLVRAAFFVAALGVTLRARKILASIAFATFSCTASIFAFTNAGAHLPALARAAAIVSTPAAATLLVAVYFSARHQGLTDRDGRPWTL